MTMCSRATLAALLIALGGLTWTAGAAPTPADPGPFLMSGVITALAADSIAVTQGSKTVKIATDAATVWKLDGKVVAPGDLKIGLAVGVWGTAGKPAVEIHAFTPKPK
jgi:hypothetical protein